MFQNYNFLAFNSPFYFSLNNSLVIDGKLPILLNQFGNDRVIDPIAIIEFLSKKYVLGDRTLIQGVYRSPWMAKPNSQLNSWEYAELPPHGFNLNNESEIAQILFKKICSEIQFYVGSKKQIGVLLSGGMDSRMVAGALDYLIRSQQLEGVEVTGLTWGNVNTRDVVYAKEITQRLDWKWKHYMVTATDLSHNILETAIHGCEYSPIHLHAIPQIRDDNKELELILAGSYGDSIGRAEYAGWNVNYLRPILKNVSNFSSFVLPSLYKKSFDAVKDDVDRYHSLFSQKDSLPRNELDYQLHYMRRMLNPCMELLSEKVQFNQVFTKPEVFGYMWSISPQKRNDLVYKYMLKEFATKLDGIPWARTGVPYGEKGRPDIYLKSHYSYVQIIREELINEIESLIFSGNIEKLNVFNLKSIKNVIKLIKDFPSNNLRYHEEIIWLASLAKMVDIYKISGLVNCQEATVYSKSKLITLEYFLFKHRGKFAPQLKKYFQEILSMTKI